MVHITKLVEDEKKSKESLVKKQEDDFKSLEVKIKKYFQEEREVRL
jgi:hypothetical protein